MDEFELAKRQAVKDFIKWLYQQKWQIWPSQEALYELYRRRPPPPLALYGRPPINIADRRPRSPEEDGA